jgi:hypothetical protein
MIRIAITAEAFDAVAKTLSFGSVGFETKVNADGSRAVWLDPRVLDRLGAIRGPGETISDVILKLVRLEASL